MKQLERYEIQEINGQEGLNFRVTDKTTDSRVATCYLRENAELVLAALNRSAALESTQSRLSVLEVEHVEFYNRAITAEAKDEVNDLKRAADILRQALKEARAEVVAAEAKVSELQGEAGDKYIPAYDSALNALCSALEDSIAHEGETNPPIIGQYGSRLRAAEARFKEIESLLEKSYIRGGKWSNERSAMQISLQAAEAKVSELQVCIKNQEAMISGRHQYVGQDFRFRLDRAEAKLKEVERERDAAQINLNHANTEVVTLRNLLASRNAELEVVARRGNK